MKGVFEAVKRVIQKHPDIEVIYPVHPNPVLQEAVAQELEGYERIHLTEPLDVVDLHHIMQRSYLVLTDSGGIQEEAPSLGKPVLVLRDKTERPEGVTAGTLKCVGTKCEAVQAGIEQLLTDKEAYHSMARAHKPFGDGTASRQIVSAIQQFFQSQGG